MVILALGRTAKNLWTHCFVHPKNEAEGYMDIKERLLFLIEDNRERLIEICRRLIDIESVTGNEKRVQEEVEAIFREIGMEIDMWEPDDEELRRCEYFSETGESFKNRPVVVGRLPGKAPGRGRSLLINGHVDVVTPEPIGKWNTDPFQMEICNGRLYGRGASDMKTGLATAIFCVEMLKKCGGANSDITIMSVPGEENGGNGTVAAIMRGYTQFDGAVYPEPTSNCIQPAHRGAAFWRIHIDGKASHGGTKYKGVSAVEKGIKIVQALAELEKTRHENICSKNIFYKDYPLSAPVTVGIFRGGQFTSGVPEYCMIEGCIEYVYGEHSADVTWSLEETVAAACVGDPWMETHPPKVEWFGLRYEPAATERDHPMVKLAEACYEEITGKKAVVNGFEAGTDMRLIRNPFGVPGFMFGAGDISMAHAPNEFVNIEKLMENAKVLCTFMAAWCGMDGKKDEMEV